MNWSKSFLIAALATIAGKTLHADILSQALFSLPAQTEYVEYENLVRLRKLRDFARLEQRYSGKRLEQVRTALNRLGIRENQVKEMVAASSSTEFYGLLAGNFSEPSANESTVGKRTLPETPDRSAFCPGGEMCILFLQDSLAAFGSLNQLETIVKVREDSAKRISSNAAVVSLLNSADQQAPVRGALVGGQLESAISDTLSDLTGWKRDWSRLSSEVRDVSYSVKFDDKAHFTAAFDCKSAMSSTLLLETLRLLESVQSMHLPGGNSGTETPFSDVRASSSGTTVNLSANTPY